MVIIGANNVPASKKLAPELGKPQQRTLANNVHHVHVAETLTHQCWHIGGAATSQIASYCQVANRQPDFGDFAPQSCSQQGVNTSTSTRTRSRGDP
jgi:hypothetical protein